MDRHDDRSFTQHCSKKQGRSRSESNLVIKFKLHNGALRHLVFADSNKLVLVWSCETIVVVTCASLVLQTRESFCLLTTCQRIYSGCGSSAAWCVMHWMSAFHLVFCLTVSMQPNNWWNVYFANQWSLSLIYFKSLPFPWEFSFPVIPVSHPFMLHDPVAQRVWFRNKFVH